jgi:cytochrome c oxidase subunit 1
VPVGDLDYSMSSDVDRGARIGGEGTGPAGATTEGRVGVRGAAAAGAAGLAGTAAMAPFLVLASLVGALDLAAFAGLAEIVGLGPSVPLGLIILVGGGATTFPLLFLTLGPYLPGRTVGLKGLVFATVVWTGFVPGYYAGRSGVLLAVFLLLSLAAHWAYGTVLGVLVGRHVTDFVEAEAL